VGNNFENARNALAETVRERRRTYGWSQEELAHRVGIDRTYASQIERAIANPSLEVLVRLAEELECSVSDLIS
jgi:transcriptional regulator with XRE-family HTH domain